MWLLCLIKKSVLYVTITCNRLEYIKGSSLPASHHSSCLFSWSTWKCFTSNCFEAKSNTVIAVPWDIWPVNVFLQVALLAWLYRQWTIKLWLPHQVAGRRLPDHWQSIPWPRCPNHSCQSLNIAEANWEVVPIVLTCPQTFDVGSCKMIPKISILIAFSVTSHGLLHMFWLYHVVSLSLWQWRVEETLLEMIDKWYLSCP